MDQPSGEGPIRKISLRRASASYTHLPKFDLPQHHSQSPFSNEPSGSFTRYLGLGGLAEGGASNLSLASFGRTDSSGLLKSAGQSASATDTNQQQQVRGVTGLDYSSNNTGLSLKKSATAGISLFGGQQQQSGGDNSSFFANTPISSTTAKDDGGLTMTVPTRPSLAAEVLAADSSVKKSTLFGGLASFLSFDNLLNKPLPDLKDREANYRLIMALER